MAGRHRYHKHSTTVAVRFAAVATVLAGGMTAAAYLSRDGHGTGSRTAGRAVSPAAAGSPLPGTPWTSSRMAAATPAPTEDDSTSSEAPVTSVSSAPTSPDPAPPPSSTASAAPAAPAPAAAPSTSAVAAAVVQQQNATPFAGTPLVGTLFFTDKSAADHFCTATVVDSPAGDLVITAAHCVYTAGGGAKGDIAFVPGYHDGQSPYGQWTPSQVVVASGWQSSGDPNVDVGFLVMQKSPSGASVQSVTGAAGIAFGAGFGQVVTVPAYPSGDETPVICANPAKEFSPTQTEFDCGGYPGGTSGGPLLADASPDAKRGTVIGVIGGYQEGGDTPQVSYSSYFGSDVEALYQKAKAAG